MYLSCIKLWNFRKFGSTADFDLENPNLLLPFKKGLNVLVGENDSGKSAIIDAVKLVLGTYSYEWIRVIDEDFFGSENRLRIELTFDDLADNEAKNFTEWIGWIGEGDACKAYLRLFYDVQRNSEKILPADVRAGVDNEGQPLSAGAREYLRTTYLKPLRDAKTELVPKRNSRLSQIFQGHEAFRGKEENHHLMVLFNKFNKSIEKYFEGKDAEGMLIESDAKGKALKDEIDKYIRLFYASEKESKIDVAKGSLKNVLEKLELSIKDEVNPGLGTLNRLFMASELVHLNKKGWLGLRLGLIEELEAHLHPQVQMQVIEGLERETGIQIILTTHSPNLASKVKLNDLVICNSSQTFPMGEKYTKLDPSDYKFLEWFLDVTKSNLFFAKGVIMVEGWAEEILIPALAKKMKQSNLIIGDLTETGVSIVNVAGTSLLRYSKVFLRKDGPEMNVPVAVVTDVDMREYDKIRKLDEDGKVAIDENGRTIYDYSPRASDIVSKDKALKITAKETEYNSQRVKAFVAPHWTFEYCLLRSSSLTGTFKTVFKKVHSMADENNIEQELAKKLINKGLNKTEIAYQLAQALEEDANKEFPEIVIDENDDAIKYLIGAIKHACRC